MSKIPLEQLECIKEKVEQNTTPLHEIVYNIISEHCKSLDKYMSQVDELLCSGNNIPTSVLETMMLNLNSLLYWTGAGLEETTLKESMAKMIKEEQYNQSYNEASGTMGDKKASATLQSQKEDIIKNCYTNAIALYKHKIDYATEMASSMKKILTHRIAEYQLGRIDIK